MSTTGVKRFLIRVQGRVQGVGFRFYTQDLAANLGLSGWVENIDGGAVEIEVQGATNDIDSFIESVKIGPTLAYVKSIDITEIPVITNEDEFIIK